MQKTSFFAAALFDRLFRASPSSLKRDVNNSIQGSNSLPANGTVAQSSGGEWWTAEDEPDRQFDFENPGRLASTFFFLLTYLSLLT